MKPTDAALIPTTAALLYLAGMFPITRMKDYPVTLVSPVALACLLWTTPAVTAISGLIALLIHSQSKDLQFSSRRAALYFAFQTVTATLLTGLLSPRLPEFPASGIGAVLRSPAFVAARSAAAWNGALFACLVLGFSALYRLHRLRGDRKAHDLAIRYLHHNLIALLAGAVPITLIAPLGVFSAIVMALVALCLAFAASSLRQRMEIYALKEQLVTAEMMSVASVSEDEELTAEGILQKFLSLSSDLVDYDRAIVWQSDQETGDLIPFTGMPNTGRYEGDVVRFGEGLIGHAAARKQALVVADAARNGFQGKRETASGAWLLYPIKFHERVLGVAHFYRSAHRPFTDEDTARLKSLIPQAAIAWENVRIRETVNQLASTDGLTALWNQRKMSQVLRDEMRRSTRYHRPLSVLMLDVDSFKSFNDSYGHPQGDQLLRSIGNILRDCVRTVDFVGRYGGEEFIVILPETSKDDACRMAERVREAVEEFAVIEIDGHDIRRTVSVGVAAFPEDALNPAEIVERADEAMYRAKRAGKNRVLWA